MEADLIEVLGEEGTLAFQSLIRGPLSRNR